MAKVRDSYEVAKEKEILEILYKKYGYWNVNKNYQVFDHLNAKVMCWVNGIKNRFIMNFSELDGNRSD